SMVTQAEVERQQKRQKTDLSMRQQLARVSGPVARAGSELCVQVRPQGARCVFDFHIEKSKDVPGADGAINAYADGTSIYVTPGMMRFIESDEELALILS